ncbi:g5800 [Coccomyxa elongata]
MATRPSVAANSPRRPMEYSWSARPSRRCRDWQSTTVSEVATIAWAAAAGVSCELDLVAPSCRDDLKALYKTGWELKQRTLVDIAADRGAFIDQSQSFNVHMSDPNFGKLTSLHFYAWKAGLKTCMYYLRTHLAASSVTAALKERNGSPGRQFAGVKIAALDEKMQKERELAAMVCSLENKDACADLDKAVVDLMCKCPRLLL